MLRRTRERLRHLEVAAHVCGHVLPVGYRGTCVHKRAISAWSLPLTHVQVWNVLNTSTTRYLAWAEADAGSTTLGVSVAPCAVPAALVHSNPALCLRTPCGPLTRAELCTLRSTQRNLIRFTVA